jgi:hypothetical protein
MQHISDPMLRNEVALIHQRAHALGLYKRWLSRHPSELDPSTAISCVGSLYEILTDEARARQVSGAGVRCLHERLKILGGGS